MHEQARQPARRGAIALALLLFVAPLVHPASAQAECGNCSLALRKTCCVPPAGSSPGSPQTATACVAAPGSTSCTGEIIVELQWHGDSCWPHDLVQQPVQAGRQPRDRASQRHAARCHGRARGSRLCRAGRAGALRSRRFLRQHGLRCGRQPLGDDGSDGRERRDLPLGLRPAGGPAGASRRHEPGGLAWQLRQRPARARDQVEVVGGRLHGLRLRARHGRREADPRRRLCLSELSSRRHARGVRGVRDRRRARGRRLELHGVLERHQDGRPCGVSADPGTAAVPGLLCSPRRRRCRRVPVPGAKSRRRARAQ